MQEEQPAAEQLDEQIHVAAEMARSRHMMGTPHWTLPGVLLAGLDSGSPDVLLGDGLGAQPGQGMCPAEQLSRWGEGAVAFQPVR